MNEVIKTPSTHKVEGMNNQNKSLSVDTITVSTSTDLRYLTRVAEALSSQVVNIEKGLEFHRNRPNPSESDMSTIGKMSTNYRHQVALLHQIENRIYQLNPKAYVNYKKFKESGYTYSGVFYSIVKEKLPKFIFNWLEKAAKDQFSITNH